ncbi:MAG: hypothetical protein AB7P01_11140 [Bacteroidia bacterium]
MKRQLSAIGTLLAFAFAISSCNSAADKTNKTDLEEKPVTHQGGWFKAGSDPQYYTMGIVTGAGRDGKNTGGIKSNENKINGFGTYMQTCLADNYKGKRIKMTGYVKTENVSDWAGLWLRVDVDTAFVAFDNMHDGKKKRSITGTTEWTMYEIVLDVPANSTTINFGALLVGTGEIWFDDISFTEVDNSVETTGITTPYDLQNPPKPFTQVTEPYNLDFES